MKGFTAILGLGFLSLSFTLLKNEKRLLHRCLELEMALEEKKRKRRRELLFGR